MAHDLGDFATEVEFSGAVAGGVGGGVAGCGVDFFRVGGGCGWVGTVRVRGWVLGWMGLPEEEKDGGQEGEGGDEGCEFHAC